MKAIFTCTLLAISNLALADCTWAVDAVKRDEQRVQMAEDAFMKRIYLDKLDNTKQHLTQCIETDQRHAEETARRAKLPAPSIGQRKQNINWGYPTSISTTTTAQGVVEFQHYAGGAVLMYVNNKLSSIHN